ncbi:MAG TPA: hypothetical protein DEB30_03470 [Candidatus Peribacter riflensis]|nr:MAG: hypothetical protein A2398_00080 [Candidatus Peribacteria bacterium RIFOXYB1_FULL_57_12]OGJ83138.1 MAG: hypothetical protein A2412_05055 [Candidatus Peribacteria bacterium RIFOXYC1_FULL_58_8]HBH19835.1 hypothetical protein [Candidatus Peribacter riflensis]HBU09829.1 hypothetical protein [Candidatus Peribacter riflensis]
MAPPDMPKPISENTESRVESQAPAAPDTAQRTEVPLSDQERQEVRLTTAEGEEGLHQEVAASRLEQYQPPSKPGTPEEEDLGTNKGAFDKISDGMQKAFELVQKFMKQIQSMGSSTLRGMAKTLGMLGFKQAAEWLNEMAGADYAELVSALKRGNLAIAPVNPDDADAQAKSELAEGAQMQMAEQYKVLAQTRGPAFTREVYYTEVVREWKKKEGNGAKTKIDVEDLQAMVAASRELPPVLAGQVAQAPEFVSPLESIATPMNVMGGTPAKMTVSNKTVSMQAGPNGELLISVASGTPVRYRLSPKVDGMTGLTWQMRSMVLSKDGLQIDGTVSYQVGSTNANNAYASKLIAMTEVRPFLESVVNNPNGAPVVGTDFRFERIQA